MRTKTAILGILLFFCYSAGAEIVPVNSNSKVIDGIEYYVQTDKSVYTLGENVEILFRVSNLGDNSLTLGQVIADPLAYYDFRIKQGDNPIWQYPYLSVVLGFRIF